MDSRSSADALTAKWLNIGCGIYPAPKPWVNVDVVRNESVPADVVIDAEYMEWPWESHTVERVYLGHVLEHVPWERIPAFMDEVLRVTQPGAEVMVVGPDVLRTIERYRAGDEDFEAVLFQIEDDHDYQAWARGHEPWDGLRHCWNAYAARIVRVLERGGFVKIEQHEISPAALSGWPVVASGTQTQCAVSAAAP